MPESWNADEYRNRATAWLQKFTLPGFGYFALTIRCGIAGDRFRFRARLGR